MNALLLGLFLLAQPVSAQDQADFAAANEKALAGDTDGAVALYQSLIERGLRNEDVLFNLGTVQAQAGRLVEATVAFERALRLAPRDAGVRENLERVRRKLRGGEAVTPLEQPAEAVEPWVSWVPSRWAQLGYVAAWAAFFSAWFLRRRRREPGPARLSAGLQALALTLGLGLGAALIGQEWVRLDARAVVLEDHALFEGPDPRFPEAGRALAGSRARVLGQDGAWSKVQSEEGHTGWIEARRLVLIDGRP